MKAIKSVLAVVGGREDMVACKQNRWNKYVIQNRRYISKILNDCSFLYCINIISHMSALMTIPISISFKFPFSFAFFSFIQMTRPQIGYMRAPPGRSDVRTPNIRRSSWRRSSSLTCTSRGTGGTRWRAHST